MGVIVGQGARVGEATDVGDLAIACVGKNTTVPPNFVVERNAVIGTDLDADQIREQYPDGLVPAGEHVKFKSRTS